MNTPPDLTFNGAVVRSFASRGWPLGVVVLTPTYVEMRPGFSAPVRVERNVTAVVRVQKLRLTLAWSTYFVFRLADGSNYPRLFLAWRPSAFRGALEERGWPVEEGPKVGVVDAMVPRRP